MPRIFTPLLRVLSTALLVTQIGLGIASAQQDDESLAAGVGLRPNRDYLSLLPFELIDTASSNVILTFTDLALPGNAGREFRFQRVFNNRIMSPDRRQWRFGINGLPMRVIEKRYPLGDDPLPLPHTVQDNIRWAPYLEMVDGSNKPMVFLGIDGVPRPSWPNSMNWVTTADFWRYNRAAKKLYLPDGLVAEYALDPADASGLTLRLVGFADPFGNRVSITWQDPGLLVTQDLGNGQSRAVTIALDPATQLPTSLTYDNRTWTYLYESSIPRPGLLTSVLPPLGRPWSYQYGADTGPSYGKITKVLTPGGAEVTYAYDLQVYDEGSGPEYADVLVSRSVSGERLPTGTWMFTDYSMASGGAVGSVTVSTPTQTNQRRVTYEHSVVGGGMSGNYALVRRVVRDANNIEIERQTNSYQSVRTVVHSQFLAFESTKLRTRTIRRDGRDYVTTYTYSTTARGLHHLQKIEESGDAETARRTDLVFTYNDFPFDGRPEPFLASLLTQENIAEGTQYVSRGAQYDLATGFRKQALVGGAVRIATNFVPDAQGNVATATTASDRVTSFGYDWGVESRVQTAAHTLSRVINPDGTVAQETFGGKTTAFTYDALQRVTHIQPPGLSAPTLIDYDDYNGRTTSTRGSMQAVSTLDGFDREVEREERGLSDPSLPSIFTRIAYDAEGRIVRQGYPFTITDIGTTISYDALGRVTRQTNPDGTFSERVYGAGTVTILDEESRQTVETRTAFGDPDRFRIVQLTDANGKLWTYKYSPTDRVTRMTAEDGVSRAWEYDPRDLLMSETHPEVGNVIYYYDNAGLPSRIWGRGTDAYYTRDDNDRIVAISASGRTTTFSYESGSDNIATMTSGNVTTAFSYDGSGRVASRIDTVGSESFTTAYAYNTTDQIITITYPYRGSSERRRVGYDYDAMGRIWRIFDPSTGLNFASDFSYHASRALTGFRSGNGVINQFTIDPYRYWIRSASAANWTLQYDNYDAVGNVRDLVDSRDGKSQSFQYDSLDRLIGAVGPYGQFNTAYDAHGNRQSAFGFTYEYEPGKFWLKSQNGTVFGYDTAGRLASAPNRTFTYTPQGNLETVSAYGVQTTYTYDAVGERIAASTQGSTTYSLRGATGELLTEWRNPTGSSAVRDYVYADGRLIAAIGRPLSDTTEDPSGSIAVDGPPVTISLTAGQPRYLLFDATVGMRLVLLLKPSAGTCTRATMYRPDNGLLSESFTTCSDALRAPVLATANGQYTLLLEHSSGSGTTIATLFDVQDVVASILTDGTPSAVQVSKPGQKVRLLFEGMAGQRIAVATSAANDACLYSPVAVKTSSGSTVLSATACGSLYIEPVALPSSGGYEVSITPSGTTTGSGSVRLYTVVDVSGTLTVDGAPSEVSLPIPGQIARLTFAGTLGQQVVVRVTGNGLGSPTVSLRRADNTVLQQSSSTGSFNLATITLPATETYTVVVDPAAASTGSITVTVTAQ